MANPPRPKFRRHRARDDSVMVAARRGEAQLTGNDIEKPIVLWIDDMNFVSWPVTHSALAQKIDFIEVSSEEEIIDLLRLGYLPVHRLACIVQDMNRPRGSFASTIGRYRRKARGIFPLDTPGGDLAFYLRDQFFPMSSLVFHSGTIDTGLGLIEAWVKRAANVFAIQKPANVEELGLTVELAVSLFVKARRGLPLSEEARLLLPAIEELASITSLDPSTLERMHARQFEEMISSIFSNHGFNTTLTQPSRDGGYDLVLLTPRNSNKDVILVECKKFHPRRCVDVSIVRALYGVKTLRKASSAYIVTSSYVSPYAKREFETVTPIEMNFFERTDVLQWCARHLDSVLAMDNGSNRKDYDGIAMTTTR